MQLAPHRRAQVSPTHTFTKPKGNASPTSVPSQCCLPKWPPGQRSKSRGSSRAAPRPRPASAPVEGSEQGSEQQWSGRAMHTACSGCAERLTSFNRPARPLYIGSRRGGTSHGRTCMCALCQHWQAGLPSSTSSSPWGARPGRSPAANLLLPPRPLRIEASCRAGASLQPSLPAAPPASASRRWRPARLSGSRLSRQQQGWPSP